MESKTEEWPRTSSGDIQLHCAVAWCGRLMWEGERTVLRAVVRVGGPGSAGIGGPRTYLERAKPDAMSELTWEPLADWCNPDRHLQTLVEILIDVAGERPKWDDRKFEYTQVYPIKDGQPGIARPLDSGAR